LQEAQRPLPGLRWRQPLRVDRRRRRHLCFQREYLAAARRLTRRDGAWCVCGAVLVTTNE
jgi:hypothetical protein